MLKNHRRSRRVAASPRRVSSAPERPLKRKWESISVALKGLGALSDDEADDREFGWCGGW
jgi:hypothetical protein